ncbi:hypothetical protein DR116_0017515 [Bacillus cereus]|uniref:Uncharacterized protein n=1 Tax=Bacillus cereus TaxID=1396 RepID=A0A9X8IYD7_BACCE|nr:hypothetical protein DR116_0017515 [Bacillus cereus]
MKEKNKKEHHASVLYKIGGNTLSWMFRLKLYVVEIRPKIYFQLNRKEQLAKANCNENIITINLRSTYSVDKNIKFM